MAAMLHVVVRTDIRREHAFASHAMRAMKNQMQGSPNHMIMGIRSATL